MDYYIGVDIGGTNTEIGILDTNGVILNKKTIKTDPTQGAEKTFERVWEASKEISKEICIDENKIKSIGIGLPGPVVDNSILKIAANLSWGDNFPAKELMEKISGKSVKIENDARAIALGEYLFGAAQKYKNSMIISIGTGLSVGIIIDGKILSGAGGAAGEFGHMVVEDNGYSCGCGLKGCLETYCSANGIVREAKRRLEGNIENGLYKKFSENLEKLEAKDIFEMAKSGDKFSQEIVDFFCRYMAKGIGTLLNIINPEAVIFTGGVSKAGDFLLEGIEKHLGKYTLGINLENLKFGFGQLNEEGGIKGAVAIVMLSDVEK